LHKIPCTLVRHNKETLNNPAQNEQMEDGFYPIDIPVKQKLI